MSEVIRDVHVRLIKNGYLLTVYHNGEIIEWYCLHLDEVAEKMARYI